MNSDWRFQLRFERFDLYESIKSKTRFPFSNYDYTSDLLNIILFIITLYYRIIWLESFSGTIISVLDPYLSDILYLKNNRRAYFQARFQTGSPIIFLAHFKTINITPAIR